MSYIYFVQVRGAGYCIKISKTDDCPYVRLDNLRSLSQNRHIELLGAIPISIDQSLQRKNEIQSEFEFLRDTQKRGDWFLPGTKLVAFIGEHARPHLCDQSCSGGTTIEEQMRARDNAAGAAIAKAMVAEIA